MWVSWVSYFRDSPLNIWEDTSCRIHLYGYTLLVMIQAQHLNMLYNHLLRTTT